MPKSEITAFEPLKKNIDILTRTINYNKIKNITLIGKAVSNKTGIEKFVIDDFSGATSQFLSLMRKDDEYQISNAYGLRKTVEVETIKLDELIENEHSIPDLMKVDIEEAEELMFHGAHKIIDCKKTIFIVETFSMNVIKLFKNNDYAVFLLDESSNYAFVPKKYIRTINAIKKEYKEI